jgi:ATP-binding cassette subfamily G (WHITE) protein 2 (PDR)
LQQPSSDIFFRFDQLLLLKRGGETVYFGSVLNRARPLVDYMSEKSGAAIPTRTNPANWMLNVIGTRSSHATSSLTVSHAHTASDARSFRVALCIAVLC